MNEAREKWDRHYQRCDGFAEAIAAEVLSENSFLLPKRGDALDLACGLGGNALLLAKSGLQVRAWDISPVALQLLQRSAARSGVDIATKAVDIQPSLLPEKAFDVIIVSRFLDRSLSDAIIASLKRDGLLFYQTFSADKLGSQGPNNPAYLLQRNELLRLFAPLTLLYYREYARVGDLERGDRDEVGFIGQKTN